MAECQSMHLRLNHRYREQAPSHIWIVYLFGRFIVL